MSSKIHAILTKEFKLLFRSKSSTLAVLLGPLILILMVGLVFTNATEQELIIGVTSEDFPNSAEYVASLESAFTVIPYDTDCQEDVRRGTIVSCIALSAATPPKATIYVDPSNVNVVYAVIDQITGQLENQTGTLRANNAEQLLRALSNAQEQLLTNHEELSAAQLLLEQQQERVQTLAQDIQGIRVDVQTVDQDDLDQAFNDSTLLRNEYRELLTSVLRDYAREADNSSQDKVDAYEEAFDALNNRTDNSTAEDVFESISSSMRGIRQQQELAETSARAISDQASQIATSMRAPLAELGQSTEEINTLQAGLGGVNITQTDLTRPLEPIIQPVTTQEDDFAFMFPYFIMLIVMFTTLLLASTIIVREKNSSAYFRNFATPTPEWVFVLATYATTMIVLCAQLLIISIAATFFLSFSLFSFTTLLILFLATTFFTLFGMLLGYMFKSYEGVMLASIASAALMLFVSDLVLPASTIPGIVQLIIQANPLVLSAQLLNASIVFEYGITDILAGFVTLILYSAIMFMLIMIIQRLARIRYFEVASAHEHINRFLGQQEIVEGKELILGEWRITSKQELQHALSLMTDEEYEKYASHKFNRIADWVLDVYKDEKLAFLLLNKSRKGAILVLQKYV